MTTPRIAAVATATPPHRFTQAELLALAGYRDRQRRGFFERSEIDGRHLWVDPARFQPSESVDEAQQRFQTGALELGEAAARRALARAGWSAADLDFLTTTTCTGRLTPSLDAHLIQRLGCRPEIQRAHIGDTGCASAVVALQQAWNHLQAFSGHRALVVAVEVCSAAYFLDERLESAVAHAIFADGAGALALAAGAPPGHGIRVSGGPAPRGALQGRAPHRRRDGLRDGPGPVGGAGPQAGRHPGLGVALGGAAGAGAGAGPARPR